MIVAIGHASASITLGWYAHAIPEKDHEAADLLGSLLAGNAEEGGKNVATADENPVETPENGEETGLEKVSNLSPPAEGDTAAMTCEIGDSSITEKETSK